MILTITHIFTCIYTINKQIRQRINEAPRGFREKGYLFTGSWGALVIILRELEKQAFILGIKGALQKVKNKCKKSQLKTSILLDLFKKMLRWGGGGEGGIDPLI